MNYYENYGFKLVWKVVWYIVLFEGYFRCLGSYFAVNFGGEFRESLRTNLE